jgi:hypothetical protein
MRIGVTTDIDQQRGVIHRHPVPFAEISVVSQPQRDQALAQDVFHGLAEPQIHAERQRCDKLS